MLNKKAHVKNSMKYKFSHFLSVKDIKLYKVTL